jgi:hypothetical protein
MAQKIINAFASNGFNKIKQATAVATAHYESGLDPKIINSNHEHSVGLFQLNMARGARGDPRKTHKTETELQDPDINIKIVIDAALDQTDPFGRNFGAAGTLDDAVKAFVTDFENPKKVQKEIDSVTGTARQLLA